MVDSGCRAVQAQGASHLQSSSHFLIIKCSALSSQLVGGSGHKAGPVLLRIMRGVDVLAGERWRVEEGGSSTQLIKLLKYCFSNGFLIICKVVRLNSLFAEVAVCSLFPYFYNLHLIGRNKSSKSCDDNNQSSVRRLME